MIAIEEAKLRILASLEEAWWEYVTPMLNTIVEPVGDVDELRVF